ncbi:MAG: hypothetical protein CMP22_02375 [Rickettsiales bacterium]|nr:hypothetical protein [Rickettsiales bacterium]|tara:strand:- start:658 stop:1395 length:738 start_codon:yes stop_codon:yes gene_type:complete
MLDAFKKTFFYIMLGIVFLGLLAMGSWQTARMQWKENLILTIEEAKKQEPVSLVENISSIENNAFQWRYRSVDARLTLDQNSYKLLIPKTRDGVVGAELITIASLENGDQIIVNLGFLEGQNLDLNAVLDQLNLSDDVAVSGYLKIFPYQGMFQNDNDFSMTNIYWLDANSYIESTNRDVDQFVPFIFEVESKITPDLMPHELSTDLPNNHFKYAIFWYTMAFVFVFLLLYYYLYHKKSEREMAS